LIIRRLAVVLILAGLVAITAVGCGGDAANPKVDGPVPTFKQMTPAGGAGGGAPAGKGQSNQ
jgi:hypothetical protein